MTDHIFRQYDIRGKIGSELAVAQIYDLTKAILYFFKQKNKDIKIIAVGADGRIHSDSIKQEMCRAIQDSGLDVIFVGRCPSPVLYFSLFQLPVDAGLMITASHNGPEYNGIKICLGKESIWGNDIQEIKELFYKRSAIVATTTGSYKEHDVVSDYIMWLKKQFPHLVNMPLSAVVDCGNGAAGYVLPALMQTMEWQHVELLYADVDGTYPHHEADPTVEKNMLAVKEVLTSTAMPIGLGFDGDCDRMVPMTKNGQLVSGDKLLAIFAQDILQQHPGASIVFDIKCSSALQELINTWGGNPIISPSGHSIIKNQMKHNQAFLAGELSCHFFFNDGRYFGYDDGIYAMLRLFEILIKHNTTIEQLLAMFPKRCSTPEIRIDCPEEYKATIVNQIKQQFAQRSDVDMLTIDGIRVTMPYGWGILRSSNTQPVLCLRFEGNSPENLKKIRDDFYEALLPFYDATFLQKYLAI